jgi:hypothetical protein
MEAAYQAAYSLASPPLQQQAAGAAAPPSQGPAPSAAQPSASEQPSSARPSGVKFKIKLGGKLLGKGK